MPDHLADQSGLMLWFGRNNSLPPAITGTVTATHTPGRIDESLAALHDQDLLLTRPYAVHASVASDAEYFIRNYLTWFSCKTKICHGEHAAKDQAAP